MHFIRLLSHSCVNVLAYSYLGKFYNYLLPIISSEKVVTFLNLWNLINTSLNAKMLLNFKNYTVSFCRPHEGIYVLQFEGRSKYLLLKASLNKIPLNFISTSWHFTMSTVKSFHDYGPLNRLDRCHAIVSQDTGVKCLVGR